MMLILLRLGAMQQLYPSVRKLLDKSSRDSRRGKTSRSLCVDDNHTLHWPGLAWPSRTQQWQVCHWIDVVSTRRLHIRAAFHGWPAGIAREEQLSATEGFVWQALVLNAKSATATNTLNICTDSPNHAIAIKKIQQIDIDSVEQCSAVLDMVQQQQQPGIVETQTVSNMDENHPVCVWGCVPINGPVLLLVTNIRIMYALSQALCIQRLSSKAGKVGDNKLLIADHPPTNTGRSAKKTSFGAARHIRGRIDAQIAPGLIFAAVQFAQFKSHPTQPVSLAVALAAKCQPCPKWVRTEWRKGGWWMAWSGAQTRQKIREPAFAPWFVVSKTMFAWLVAPAKTGHAEGIAQVLAYPMQFPVQLRGYLSTVQYSILYWKAGSGWRWNYIGIVSVSVWIYAKKSVGRSVIVVVCDLIAEATQSQPTQRIK
jgi:hypothetical protein